MREFRLNDRVSIYARPNLPGATAKGVIISIGNDCAGDFLEIKLDGTENVFYFHPKQCRLLKPKQPRRRIWMFAEQLSQWYNPPGDYRKDLIEFIEVKKK